MSLKTIVFALGLMSASIADAQEPVNLLDQVQPAEQVVFVEKPVVQEIPKTPEIIEPEPELSVAAKQLDCLARVMHHEARGEGLRGQKAVGYVVVNRSNDRRFPSTICKVATQPRQFSNFSLRKRIKNYDKFYSLAQEVVSSYSRKSDPTNGALYFHSTSVRPGWSHRKAATATIKRHVFYR